MEVGQLGPVQPCSCAFNPLFSLSQCCFVNTAVMQYVQCSHDDTLRKRTSTDSA